MGAEDKEKSDPTPSQFLLFRKRPLMNPQKAEREKESFPLLLWAVRSRQLHAALEGRRERVL